MLTLLLGIDPTSGVVFIGGSSSRGERMQPQPTLTPLVFADRVEGPNWETAVGIQLLPKLLFREESYDFVSRLRRGTVFRQEDGGPTRWWVHDPMRPDTRNTVAQMGYRYEMSLIGYQSHPLEELRRKRGPNAYPKILLGDQDFCTRWTIVGIERSVSGGPLLTLRVDGFMGILPELDPNKVPEEIRAELSARLDSIVTSAARIDPGATVDLCRHALSVVFGVLCSDRSLDLAKSIDKFLEVKGEDDGVRSWAGRLVARLHSRAKPNEQQKRQTRAIDENDALLAVECVAIVLKEVGWAVSS
jgi:hypothetical protein